MENYFNNWSNKTPNAKKAAIHTERMNHFFEEQIKKSVAYSTIFGTPVPAKPRFEQTELELLETDTVSAILAQNMTDHVAALNFASYKNPGGMFLQGSQAQEEALCHESFLYNVLREFEDYYAWNRKHLNKGLYLNRAIYSPDVIFGRTNENSGSATTRFCSVITCASPNWNAANYYSNSYWTNSSEVTEEENYEALKSRIEFIFQIASQMGVDTLILGAFGCGVFGQNANTVATLMKEFSSVYNGHFKKIVFAVPSFRETANFDAFKKVFED